MANKKFYGKVEKVIKTVGDTKVATGVIQGRIVPKQELVVKGTGTGANLHVNVSIQNKTKDLKYIADQLGASLNTFEKDDNTWDTLNVTLWGFNAENFVKWVEAGDTVELFGEYTTNTYNGKTSLQMNNAVLLHDITKERGQRKTADVDAVEKTYTKPANTKEESVEQPSFNTFDDEDTPF